MIEWVTLFLWLGITCHLIIKIFLSLSGNHHIALNRKLFFFLLLLIDILITSSLRNFSWLQYPTSVLIIVLIVPTIYFSKEQIFFLLISIITVFLISFVNFLTDILLNAYAYEVLEVTKYPVWGHLVLISLELLIVYIIPKNFFGLISGFLNNNLYMNYCLLMWGLVFTCFIHFDFKHQIHTFMSTSNIEILFGLIVLFGLVLMLIVQLVIGIFYSQIKIRKKNELIAEMQKDKINEVYNTLSSFKHDYINILLSLHFALYTENIDLAKKIYEESIYPTENYLKNQKIEFARLLKITNEDIKSLFFVKITKAQSIGFDVSIDISETFQCEIDNKTDFIRLLSIFLDNSIEHGKISSSPYLAISIIKKKSIYITIENEIDKESRKKYNLRIMNQKNIKLYKNKGIGLKNALIIVKRNPEFNFETQVSNSIFRQIIIID